MRKGYTLIGFPGPMSRNLQDLPPHLRYMDEHSLPKEQKRCEPLLEMNVSILIAFALQMTEQESESQ